MKKIFFFNILITLLVSCGNKKVEMKEGVKAKSKYDIEYISYYDIPNTEKDTLLFTAVRVDTINHIGSSEYYSDSGTLMERIVIIDKNYAMRLYYDTDTIALSKICRYRVRKDHPTKEMYSIVACYN